MRRGILQGFGAGEIGFSTTRVRGTTGGEDGCVAGAGCFCSALFAAFEVFEGPDFDVELVPDLLPVFPDFPAGAIQPGMINSVPALIFAGSEMLFAAPISLVRT